MSESIRVGNRGKQVLQLLFENGPLLSSTLRTVIEPAMPQRKIRAAILRLRRLGLVRNRHSSVNHDAGRYIELSTAKEGRKTLCKVLNVSEESLKSVPGNTEALEHWQECAVWAKRLEKIFPEAKMVRDFQLAKDRKLMEAACVATKFGESLPDLLLVFPKSGEGLEPVYVGIEIERSQKSRRRLVRKLRHFAGESKLDTVLYICSRPKVAPKISRIYSTGVHKAYLRVEPYSENFLLMLEGTSHNLDRLLPSNAFGKNVPFKEWVHFLRQNRGIERAKFDPPGGASGGP